MISISHCKSLLLASAALALAACSSLPTYVSPAGAPVATVKVYNLRPSMCKDGVRYSLDTDRKTGLITIPAGEIITLNGFQSYQGYNVTHFCTASLNVRPLAGMNYIMHGDLHDRQCFTELVRADSARATGVAVEPTVGPAYCGTPSQNVVRTLPPVEANSVATPPAPTQQQDKQRIVETVVTNAPSATPKTQSLPTPPTQQRAKQPIVETVFTNAPVATPKTQAVTAPPAPTQQPAMQAVPEIVYTKQGTWSYEVEKLAKAQGCVSQGNGAQLVSKDELSEHYRMSCTSGKSFTAVCDRLECRQS